MFKKTSSRNQRSKGIRIKHVLQICLLLGVCFWLIYQLKHSHDKRKEFDEKDAKVSVKEQNDDSILKFGRKDLTRVEEVSKNYKHEEEEEEENGTEDENKHDEEPEERSKMLEDAEHEGASKHKEGTIHEEEEPEETSKHEDEEEGASKHEEEEEEEEPEEVRGDENRKHDDEEQEAEVKDEEAEDEGKGDGDDEVDGNEQGREDGEVDHEELMDEEKEREAGDLENEEKEKEGQEENEQLTNDQNLDGGAHEAREKHYKADDASSAVSHDTQIISSEADKLKMENYDGNLTRNVLEQESKANATEKADGDENKSQLKFDEGKHSEGGNSSSSDENKLELKADEDKQSDSDSSMNVTDTKENDHDSVLASSEHISLPTTNTTDFIDQASNISTEVRKEMGNVRAEADTKMPGSLQNGTSAKDTTEDGKFEEKYEERANETTSNSQLLNSDTVHAGKFENVDSTTTESSNSSTNAESGMSDDTPRINAADGGHSSESSTTKENTDSTQNEKPKGENESSGTDENSDTSSSDETVDGGHNDPIDSSDNTLFEEEKEVAVDLSTLPDITTEGSNNEDTVAE